MANGTRTDTPASSQLDWGALVRKVWGDAWHKKETAYEFTNGRKFVSPEEEGGPYADNS